jgi:hypothetical protein
MQVPSTLSTTVSAIPLISTSLLKIKVFGILETNSSTKIPDFLGLPGIAKQGSIDPLGYGVYRSLSSGKVVLQSNLEINGGTINASLPVDFVKRGIFPKFKIDCNKRSNLVIKKDKRSGFVLHLINTVLLQLGYKLFFFGYMGVFRDNLTEFLSIDRLFFDE